MPTESSARTLYPEDHRYADYAGNEWSLREVKNSKHAVFENDVTPSLELHVEADGMPAQVTLFNHDAQGDRTMTQFPVDSFQHGLEMAGKLTTMMGFVFDALRDPVPAANEELVDRDNLRQTMQFFRDDTALDSIPADSRFRAAMNPLFEKAGVDTVPGN